MNPHGSPQKSQLLPQSLAQEPRGVNENAASGRFCRWRQNAAPQARAFRSSIAFKRLILRRLWIIYAHKALLTRDSLSSGPSACPCPHCVQRLVQRDVKMSCLDIVRPGSRTSYSAGRGRSLG